MRVASGIFLNANATIALATYDLSPEEIESGWIDGGGDGGIDGFYILINGHLLDDESGFAWPRSNAAIDIWLITCKHHSTFQQATLDALLATIPEIFDFALDEADLEGTYSAELLEARGLLIKAYRRLSVGRPNVTINVVYASRGDTEKIGESVMARAKQIETTLAELFSSSSVKLSFFGASEIVDSHRKVRAFEFRQAPAEGEVGEGQADDEAGDGAGDFDHGRFNAGDAEDCAEDHAGESAEHETADGRDQGEDHPGFKVFWRHGFGLVMTAAATVRETAGIVAAVAGMTAAIGTAGVGVVVTAVRRVMAMVMAVVAAVLLVVAGGIGKKE